MNRIDGEISHHEANSIHDDIVGMRSEINSYDFTMDNQSKEKLENDVIEIPIDNEINSYDSSLEKKSKEKLENGVVEIPIENEINSDNTRKQTKRNIRLKATGVTRSEVVREKMTVPTFWILAAAIFLTAWVMCLDETTTSSYQPVVTSLFNAHSKLPTLSIGSSVIGAVAKPFIAKTSDLTARPIAYFIVLILYVIGFVVAASTQSFTAYVVGTVFIAIGQSGVDLMNALCVADTTKLKWRPLFHALLSLPFLVTTWISGYIYSYFIKTNWRWGYGIFAIITPGALMPSIAAMCWIEYRANKKKKEELENAEVITIEQEKEKNEGIQYGLSAIIDQKKENIEYPPSIIEQNKMEPEKHVMSWREKWKVIWDALIEIDAFGLILMGFAFSLILFPPTLYAGAKGGWNNPSMIAMEVVGGVLLICHVIYEIWFAPFPILPKRVLFNRTFICCVIIDFIYQMAGAFWLDYFTSYTLVVLNLTDRDWVYLSNTETMGLCFFGILWGGIFRIFRRYKIFQVIGIGIKLIGMGLYVACSNTDSSNGGPGIGLIVAGYIITSFGDGASVVCTQIAAQAAVPHRDLAATISVLSLYTSIGAAVGSSVTAAVWTSKLPKALNKYVPDSQKAAKFFESVDTIHSEPWHSSNRRGAIKAYQEVNHVLFCMALGVSSLDFIVSFFQTNFYLGDQQNCVEGEQKEDYNFNSDGSKKTVLNRFVDFCKKPLF